MIRPNFCISLILCVLGCDKQTVYAEDHAQVSCELYDDCEVLELMGDFEGMDGCVTQLAEDFGLEGSECAEFAESHADDCLEAILLMTCDDLYSSQWPESCDEVCN